MSLASLKRRVKQMIEEEDAAHPLTDEQITKKLSDEGIHVTRRTVAKYREDLRIPSTHRRRVKVKLPIAVKRPDRKRHARQLVILTGLSGSGKGSVLNTFEDLGFYCVDNLPVALIPTFSELYEEGRGEIESRRARWSMRARASRLKICRRYIASCAASMRQVWFSSKRATRRFIRRFSETRRPHPLGTERLHHRGNSRRAPPHGSNPPSRGRHHRHDEVQCP